MQNFYAPRGFAYLQGIWLPSWSIEVEQTAYNTADTINVMSVLSTADQDWGKVSQAATAPIPFRVRVGAATDPAGYNGSSFNELIYGFLDEIDSNYDDDTIEFRGRGALALLVDARTSQRVNQNVDIADAVSQLVSQVGLNPILVAGESGVKVGQIFKDDFVATGRNIRVLEFCQLLINGIGWFMRVQGENVLIGPPPAANSVPTITKTHGAGGDLSLKITHSALHAHDIKVKVVSYLPKTKGRLASSTVDTTDLLTGQGIQAPSTTSPANSKVNAPIGRQSGFATGNFQYSQQQEYVYHIPGLTAEECNQKAKAIQAELSRHEFIMDMEFAPSSTAELTTLIQSSPEFLINLRGCSQSSHNQLYHPRHVTWTISQEEGVRVKVTAVNHDIPQDTGGE